MGQWVTIPTRAIERRENTILLPGNSLSQAEGRRLARGREIRLGAIRKLCHSSRFWSMPDYLAWPVASRTAARWMAEVGGIGPRQMVAVTEAQFVGNLTQRGTLGQAAPRGGQTQIAHVAREAGAESSGEAV